MRIDPTGGKYGRHVSPAPRRASRIGRPWSGHPPQV